MQAHGYRLTEPRRTIIAALRDAGRFCTASQLYERLHGRTVGLASVYRTLELLAELGLAERRAETGGEASFLYCSPRQHHHVVCTHCGAVREIDTAFCPGDELAHDVERQTGFTIARAYARFLRPLRRLPRGKLTDSSLATHDLYRRLTPEPLAGA